MSTISYKPNNQEASNIVNIVRFTPEQQRHKTNQLYLHLCDFMMEGIGTMTKTANKYKTKKTSNCSTVLMKWLHVLLNFPIKNMTKTFQILNKCRHTRKNKLQDKKKNLAMKVVQKKKRMVIRWCGKQYNFKLNIINVCQLYHTNKTH